MYIYQSKLKRFFQVTERNISNRIFRRVDQTVVELQERVQNAIATAMNNSIGPRIEITIRSTLGTSSGRL